MANVNFTKGKSGIITYSTSCNPKENTTYLVVCDKSILNFAISNFIDFICLKVPRFGKYEVEEFVAKMLLISLIQGDLTTLMNIEISYDDFPYNHGNYSKDTIRKYILEYCEVIRQENNVVTLKYLGKKKINYTKPTIDFTNVIATVGFFY